MFFAYPEDATRENWVHECLIAMLNDVHVSVEADRQPLQWPDCFPKEHRDKFRRRRKLRDLRKNYVSAFQKIDDPVERSRIRRCMREQNEIHSLLSGESTCERIQDLPNSIRKPIEDIFETGFELIKELGVRDRHYCGIYDELPFRDCPFCGIEPFDAPIGRQSRTRPKATKISEDLDHYLPRSRYPFAAANLRNLAPAGRKCNGYKSDRDPIRTHEDQPCAAFDPYSHEPVDVSLLESVPFGAPDGELPKWKIGFIPDGPETATWDRIYEVRIRWISNDLDPHYKGWLSGFINTAATYLSGQQIESPMVLGRLKDFIENENMNSRSGRERFRAKVMEMLHYHCDEGNEHLLEFLKNSIEMAISAAPPLRSRS
jgi:hypothetical protein